MNLSPFALAVDAVSWKFKAIALVVVLAALAAAGAWFIHYEREIGRDDKQAQWDADNVQRARAANLQRERNARVSVQRAEQQAQIEQRKINEIARLNTDLARAVDELRNRPERPAGPRPAASNPTAPTACTGAELYRPDAEFLVREAARAQRVLLEREACHDKYDTLRSGQ